MVAFIKQYVMIDYENVQPHNIDLLTPDLFSVFIFLGADQRNITDTIINKAQTGHVDIHFIQIDSHGHNALDFHIAYYIGQLSTHDSEAYYYIISKDTGYDPLIKHLRQKQIYCRRIRYIENIPSLKSLLNAKKNKIELVIEDLIKRGNARPGRINTLRNAIQSLFTNSLQENEISEIIQELITEKIIVQTKNKVLYHLPITKIILKT